MAKKNKKTEKPDTKSVPVFDDAMLLKGAEKEIYDQFNKEFEASEEAEKKAAEEPPKKKRNPWAKKKPNGNDDKRDKIFGNDYNTGNINNESFPDIKIDVNFASANLEECYNSDDYSEKKEIMNRVYEAFKSSQWKNLPLDKKFGKELRPYIFNDLFKAIDDRGFSTIDMFVSIAEFMDISYEQVYEIAGLRMKERLINELENKYKILSKKNIKRLF